MVLGPSSSSSSLSSSASSPVLASSSCSFLAVVVGIAGLLIVLLLLLGYFGPCLPRFWNPHRTGHEMFEKVFLYIRMCDLCFALLRVLGARALAPPNALGFGKCCQLSANSSLRSVWKHGRDKFGFLLCRWAALQQRFAFPDSTREPTRGFSN